MINDLWYNLMRALIDHALIQTQDACPILVPVEPKAVH